MGLMDDRCSHILYNVYIFIVCGEFVIIHARVLTIKIRCHALFSNNFIFLYNYTYHCDLFFEGWILHHQWLSNYLYLERNLFNFIDSLKKKTPILSSNLYLLTVFFHLGLSAIFNTPILSSEYVKKCINKEERVRHLPGYCPETSQENKDAEERWIT